MTHEERRLIRIARLAARDRCIAVEIITLPRRQMRGRQSVDMERTLEAVSLAAWLAARATSASAAAIGRALGDRRGADMTRRAAQLDAIAATDPATARRLERLRQRVARWAVVGEQAPKPRRLRRRPPPPVDPAREHVSRRAAAAALGISRQRLERLIATGRIVETTAGVDVEQAKFARYAALPADRAASGACEAGTAGAGLRSLSRKAAATELGISRQRLERLIAKGRIVETAAGVDIEQAKSARAASLPAGRPRGCPDEAAAGGPHDA